MSLHGNKVRARSLDVALPAGRLWPPKRQEVSTAHPSSDRKF